MDENYLDNLLKGVSTDNQKKNSFDKNVEKDSTVDIDFSDLDDISLDELDSLDDISLEELDFDDIDFDDVDITNLNSKEEKSGKEYIPEEEDFDADEILEDIIGMDDLENLSEDDTDMAQLDGMDELLDAVMEEKSDEVKHEESSLSPEDIDNLFAELDSEDADEPLDRMENVFAEAESEHIQDVNSESVDSFVDELFGDAGSSDGEMSDIESMDLDDLFSALGIDETEGVVADNYVAGEDDLEQLLQNTMMNSLEDDGLADIADIGDKQTPKKTGAKSKKSAKGPKEKKSVSEILFGAPDEDDEEEERLYQIKKAEKEAKKAKDKEDKEAKKVAKQEKQEAKKLEATKKQNEKAEKKRAKEAELLAEYEAEKGTKKVPTAVVVLVFLAFAALAVVVVFGAKNFNYAQVIKKASDYFDRQRYRLAYDEVAGVEVKEEDEELRDRIYTVMYVERLYESYENNMTLNRPDKALDSLLRGLEKYDEHYQEAVSLGIAKDIKSVKEKIINALWNTYGLSEAAAYELIGLDGIEYSEALERECEGLMPTGE